MDSLASLDMDKANRNLRRVRSWYWYEQFKSLERNQMDATSQLRNKSEQQKILRQELDERRARRRMCDSYGVSQSESQFNKCITRNCSPERISASTNDIFASFFELHEENEFLKEDYSNEGSNTSKNCEEFKSLDDKNADDSSSDCMNSIVDITKRDEYSEKDIKEELKIVKQNIAENINLQLDTVKENFKCLENYAKMCDDCQSSDLDSPCERCDEFLKAKAGKGHENSILVAWTKVVAFAYQLIQLNHGNCYFDFSSQFLTAVLACDILRRGISRICHILQPYISPIKYATSESETSSETYIGAKKKSFVCKKSNKLRKCTGKSKTELNHKLKLARKYDSENYKWQHRSVNSYENKHKEGKSRRNYSEPWRSLLTLGEKINKKSSCRWPEDFLKGKSLSDENICKCSCLNNVACPLMKLARYIDDILLDVEEYPFD